MTQGSNLTAEKWSVLVGIVQTNTGHFVYGEIFVILCVKRKRQDTYKSNYQRITKKKRRYENAFLWKVSIVLLVGLIVGRVYRHQKKSNSSSSPFVVFPELQICQLIKTHAKNPDFKLNDRQWEELSIEMDIAFNAFASRLLELCPKISDVERHVSYLVKLKISPKNIAHIVVRQKNTISSILKF